MKEEAVINACFQFSTSKFRSALWHKISSGVWNEKVQVRHRGEKHQEIKAALPKLKDSGGISLRLSGHKTFITATVAESTSRRKET